MKTNNYFIIAGFLFIGYLFTSCEKVIDVDLNESKPNIVIEAKLQQGVHDFEVAVTKTTSYFESQPPQFIENATVSLTVEDGATYLLEYRSEGIYVLKSFDAIPASTYILTVDVDGTTYSSRAFLPSLVEIKELTYKEMDMGMGGFKNQQGKSYTVLCEFNDPAVVKNYYRLVVVSSGKQQFSSSGIILQNDELTDGNAMKINVEQRFFSAGDTVYVELRSVDENVYLFYKTLNSILSSSAFSSSAPSNPISNFDNGALGCFETYSSNKKTIILPD
jgi:hypothetical protein